MDTYVYVVALYTTGERWHTFVCSNIDAVIRSLDEHGITKRTYELNESEYQDWISPKDESQTATVQRLRLIN